jgi:hypothetical protein
MTTFPITSQNEKESEKFHKMVPSILIPGEQRRFED